MRLFLLAALAAYAQPVSSLKGYWEGAIHTPGGELRIAIEFASPTAGAISIPQQNAKDLPLAGVAAGADGAVAWAIPGIPGDPKFQGKLVTGGDRMEGTFTQGDAKLSCYLERKEGPGAAAKSALDGFDAIVTDAMKRMEVPGVAVAIVRGKEVVYAKGFGHRDVARQLPVDADTLFAIGSATKAFTTLALGTLVDEGRIEWDRPVRQYIPWFQLHDATISESLTVRDTVTHRSGLPRHDLVWYNNYDISREAIVRRLPALEFSAGLRERFQYNNLMFLTAGYLIETVTGGSWEGAVRQRIFAKLGMRRSNFSVDESQKDANHALPYAKRDGKVVAIPFRRITNIGPAGSINSSVNEMAGWVSAQLNRGRFGNVRIAEASTIAEMHKPFAVTGAPSTAKEILGGEYGLGWFLDVYRGRRRVHHGGNIDGFSAQVELYPDDDLGIVVLTNLNGTALRNVLPQLAADRILGLKPVDWTGQSVARQNAVQKDLTEGERKKDTIQVKNTRPSHVLAEYAGAYEHGGYGTLHVKLTDAGSLELRYNGMSVPLDHWHYDTFTGGKGPEPVLRDVKFSFQTDVEGAISGVMVAMEPAVSPALFRRKAPDWTADPAHLSRFTGDYTLSGGIVSVSLKGSSLYFARAGGTPELLLPRPGGTFQPKNQSTVTLRFSDNALEIRQPNAVLTAKRRPANE